MFHDVGALDAIVDITGACIGLHLLGVDAVHCSALPIGGGMVRGPHGPMPVPGPGTAELLKGFPLVDTSVRRELVTPTGAAILTTLAVSAGASSTIACTLVPLKPNELTPPMRRPSMGSHGITRSGTLNGATLQSM